MQMPKASERFRFALAEAMAGRQLTQQGLADICGIGRKQIAKYLGGVTTPTVDNLAALCVALGVSSDSLLGIAPVPRPPPPRPPTDAEIVDFILRKFRP